MLLAGWEGDKPDFKDVLLRTVKTLREQLDKDKDSALKSDAAPAFGFPRMFHSAPGPQTNTSRLPRVEARSIGQPRIWDTTPSTPAGRMPGALPSGSDAQREGGGSRRDVRTMASAAAALGRSFIS